MAAAPTPNGKYHHATTSAPPGGVDQTKWGTHVMSHPAAPATHPEAAVFRRAEDPHHPNYHQPYLVYSPVDKPVDNPCHTIRHKFNYWSNKAETMANNVWHNLKTGPSVSETAWGKLNLGAKAITEGGFESLYKQSFGNDPQEKLKKSFACYLSTTTGPVAGTLYLSTVNVAFCSDRPLSFTAPSGIQTWSYYKAMIPLGNIRNINRVTRGNMPEKYIKIVTVDGHEFWFIGFVNYDKAFQHLLDAVSILQTATRPVRKDHNHNL